MKRPFTLSLILLSAVIGLIVTTKATPQQQQSNGQAVSVTNFPATQPVSIASMPSTPVTGPLTDAQLRGSAVPTSLTTLPALIAGTAKIGITYPYTSCGTTAFTKALQAMPTSSTAIATATTCLLEVDLSNTSGGALTVTISDNQGTPINFLNAATLQSGESRTYTWPFGHQFTSGVKVQASGAGITYTMEGLQ